MKKIFLVLIIVIVSVVAFSGCQVAKCALDRYTEQYIKENIDEYVIPPYTITQWTVMYEGRELLMRKMEAPDGYWFFKKEDRSQLGPVLYLGCNDSPDNYYIYKYIPPENDSECE